MEKSGRTIRVDLARPGIKRITMLPLDNEGVEIMKKHGNDAEEAYSDIYDKVWREDAGQLMDFVFEYANSEYGLYVVDAETEEVIYEDDSFVPDTSCGLMSYSQAEADYREYDPDNEEDFSMYVKYLSSECQTNELYLSQGFAKAWNELSEPTMECAATFIPNFMHYALSAADAKNALLMGVEESELVTVSFYINLPEGENFDPAKLDFINIDEDYDAYSKVLQKLLAMDIILLNAIIYDGKIYFAGHDEIDILDVSDEEPIFDYVDENIAHMALPSSRREHQEGQGKSAKFEIKDGPEIAYQCFVELVRSLKLTSVVIPEGVTEIGEGTFRNCTGLTSVVIPKSVTEIGEEAFRNCTGLTSVVIPESVTKIGKSAFKGCTGLTSVVIPEGVTEIGEEAFRNCTGLTSVVIPESVTEIANDAFSDCTGLTCVVIPKGVTEIGEYAFRNCTGLTNFVIPESVTKIGRSAFYGCTGLTSVVIPKSVTEIGEDAFGGCTGLTSVVIPESVTEIAAFRDCTGLTSVVIPEGVTEIGGLAFGGCTGLTSVVIPKSVTEIGRSAFSGCTGLTSVVIPESVTKIDERAFEGCTGLTSVVVDAGNKVYDSRENCNAIIETETNLLIKGFNNTIIPKSVTEIGKSAFEGCTGLTSVVIPEGVTEIGWFAFGDCTGLTSVVIPESVTKIGERAFYGCTGLISIAVAPGNKVYDSREGCNAIIDTINRTLIQGCTTTKLPEGVSSLGADSFAGFTNLANINSLLEGVELIGERAFAGCTGLTNLTIPESVKYVCARAFNGCTGLESVVIQNAIADLDSYCMRLFEECSNLRSVTLPAGIKKIDNSNFRGCDNLNTINVPAKKADYYKKRLPENLHQFIVEMEPLKKAKKK